MTDTTAVHIIEVDPDGPARDQLRPAARALRDGKLVAFPTETVYGLGVDARDEAAVRRMFAVKDRPPSHPVILHVASAGQAAELAAEWDSRARRLAERFWPGPLTLIVEKADSVSQVVTGGLETVGVRVPGHPVARALLDEAGIPVAAPSANPHQAVSPTRAEHVVRGLGDQVDVLVDGGETDVGIESTVVSLAVRPPVILRPGQIGRARLEEVLESVEFDPEVEAPPGARRASPGMGPKHYAPDAPVVVASAEKLARMVGGDEQDADDRRLGWVTVEFEPPPETPEALHIRLPDDPEGYARNIYAALHDLDAADCHRIYIEAPPDDEPWRAVWNRLRRAAG